MRSFFASLAGPGDDDFAGERDIEVACAETCDDDLRFLPEVPIGDVVAVVGDDFAGERDIEVALNHARWCLRCDDGLRFLPRVLIGDAVAVATRGTRCANGACL